ncbi:MAG TPA: alpha-1,4-glucan--maltose-1-phosphate maltosyltransferase [Solirubrobacterales bacterium]|jgi:starch synthase (maltosyl-transferring)|nr:alpha-1,4-glucan--maltose-1-phosphate maltosyltransferase [Solirubrobacterales bacterium]
MPVSDFKRPKRGQAPEGGNGGAPGVRAEPPPRIRILDVRPQLDGGRFALKRTIGERLEVSAEVFRDGHDAIRAVLRYRAAGANEWREAPMTWIDRDVDGDRWAGSFVPDREGVWMYEVGAFTDHFATWHDEVSRKRAAGGEDLTSEVAEGAELLRDAAEHAAVTDGQRIAAALKVAEDDAVDLKARLDTVLAPRLLEAVERNPSRHDFVTADPLSVTVERERARFGAWYELFPRSWGGFDGVRAQLPRLAELGFDVLYLPPIHPIGQTNRKGANNALTAGPDDPGSPWAIGSELGGHEAIEPSLGDVASFEALLAAARAHGMEIALDFAIQCGADHPWLKEHPEWFNHRPDGTLKYAENPPKKYQDIYNLNFDCEDWKALWEALRDIVALWVERGVRVFRVDNPHTKPLPFWEWLIAEIRATHPDVIFLAEAFTRRAKMMALAKLGFSQSYTYFTWKNWKWELTEYVNELAYATADYARPNFFANTPDILTEYLVDGGPPAFEARLVLAATLSPTYGIYSGFESFENVPVRPGSEEYVDSEKYQLRERSLDGPLLPLIARLNQARRENPALQHLSNIAFLETENDALIAYAKRSGDNTVIVAVNLDPHNTQEGVVNVGAWLGTAPSFKVRDLIDDQRYDWTIGRNYLRLAPGQRMAHVMRVERP